MKVRITWKPFGFNNGGTRDYDDMDDVSLKIHNLMMNRVGFTVTYL